MVAHQVHGDAVQPGGEFRSAPEGRITLRCFDEGLLCQLFRIGAPSDVLHDEAVEPVAVIQDELTEQCFLRHRVRALADTRRAVELAIAEL